MFLFVDGNNLASRCFYAQKELRTASGVPTGAIHGFLKSLSAVRHTVGVQLQDVAVFWDAGRNPRRTALYPAYKAGRKLSQPKTQEDIDAAAAYKGQLMQIKRILHTRPIRQVQVEGAEADDIMAVLAGTVDGATVVFSGDRDFHQLANHLVSIYDPKLGHLKLPEIASYWNLPIYDKDRIVAMKAMIGDSADNIKGISGIGEKRAAKIIPYLAVGKFLVTQEHPCQDAKLQRLIDRVLESKDEEGRSIMTRNMQLMRLPGTWEDAYYEPEQMESALTQFLDVPVSDYAQFAEALKEFELDSIFQNMERW